MVARRGGRPSTLEPEHMSHRLGDLQLRILQVLWEEGSASVAEVRAALGKDLAYTTIATMLRKMEARGLVGHRSAGRRFIYMATVEEGDVSRTMVDRLVNRLFDGNLTAAVHHLLESRDVDVEELAELEKLIRRRKRRVTR